MKNHTTHIESLLELFMQGETTIEQERELSEFFANSAYIPEKWEAYRKMFAYFNAGMPMKEEKHKRNIVRIVWSSLAAAAIATIAIMVAPQLRHNHITEQTTTPQPITARDNNTIVKDMRISDRKSEIGISHSHLSPLTSHLITKQKRRSTKETPHITKHHAAIDSIEIEREKGEVEQAQQELMADKFIIEQERQEILNEQYNSRAQAYQAQLAAQNENPQLIQVVFK